MLIFVRAVLRTPPRSFNPVSLGHALCYSNLVAHCAPYPKRTHNCGSLSAGDAGARVVLAGWVLPARKAKSMSFLPLKDTYGTTQLIINHNSPDLAALSNLPVESTVLVEGTVLLRPPNARRPGCTGEIDVQVDKFTLLNPACDLPFVPSNPHNLPNDDLRAQHRYLDLRRTALSDNIKKRSKVAHIIRSTLHNEDFVEVETPVLLRSSPEGAREFLVPTRVSATMRSDDEVKDEPLFYALQQSPQQPKQLLICSGGIDKYYQIAKCFRDEDGRKDRQPEFTQIDMEMAFVSWGQTPHSSYIDSDGWRIGGHEVRDVVETLIRRIWTDVEGIELPERFKVMTYHEAMSRFGSDKPDTRFGLEIINMSNIVSADRLINSDNKEIIECIVIRNSTDSQFIKASRKCIYDGFVDHINLNDTNMQNWLLTSDIARRTSLKWCQDDQVKINKSLDIRPGDDVWLASRPFSPKGGSTLLGKVRLRLSELAQSMKQFSISTKPHFLWITEFPLFTRDDEDKDILAHGRWSSSHHPFTAPMWDDIDAMYRDEIDTVRGQHYDLVLNGVEIGGGSVRVHDAVMQDYIFTNILQLNEQEKAPFHQLLNALRCGAPPHGGIALGFDRMMSMLCNTESIRDVIAFPKSGTGTDLLFKSPAAVNSEVLYQYGIQPRLKSQQRA